MTKFFTPYLVYLLHYSKRQIRLLLNLSYSTIMSRVIELCLRNNKRLITYFTHGGKAGVVPQ